MRKHILLFILFSCLPWAARGQSAYEWTCWFDEEAVPRLSGSAVGDTLSIDDLDGELTDGFHVLHVQVADTAGRYSPPMSRLFYNAVDRSVEKLHYWFDEDLDNFFTVSMQNGISTIDVSHLQSGTHIVYCQVEDALGYASDVCSRLFYNAVDRSVKKLRYWFDEDMDNFYSINAQNGVNTIDVSHLQPGTHIVYCQAVDALGCVSDVCSRLFFRQIPTDQLQWSYWFDEDEDTKQMTTQAGESVLIDVSELADGFHTIHHQVRGLASSDVVTRMFIKIPQTENVADMTCICTVDGKLVAQKKVPGSGGIISWQMEVDSLKVGLHQAQFQVITPSGVASTLAERFFVRVMSEKELGRMKCVYSFDNFQTHTAQGTVSNGLFHFDLDVSNMADGLHRMAYTMIADDGTTTPQQTAFFWKTPVGGAGIVQYDYWLNDEEQAMKSFHLDKRENPFKLISLLPVDAQPIRSECFQFEVKDGQPMLYAKNDFHIRFFDTDGRALSETRQYVDYNVSQALSDIETLEPDVTATTDKPEENAIKWYQLTAERGDSLSFKTDIACTVQLFVPSGAEVYKASGPDVVKWGGCHAPETGTFYLALHDVTAQQGTTVSIDYQHIDKYAVLRQDVAVVGNGGCSTITFEGNGFRDLYAVDLFTEQGDSIHSVDVGHESDATTSVVFDFTDAVLGTYHAKFRFAEEDKVFNSLVTVEEARDIELATTVTYPSTFLRGTSMTYTYKITNKGNMTAYDVPIAIRIFTPDSVSLTSVKIEGFDMNKFLLNGSMSDTETIRKIPNVDASNDIGFFINVDSTDYISGHPFMSFACISPSLRPSTTETISITVKSDKTVYVYMWVPQVLEEEYNDVASSRKNLPDIPLECITTPACIRNYGRLLANGWDDNASRIMFEHNCVLISPKCPLPPGGPTNPVNSCEPNDMLGYVAESGSHAIKDGLTDVWYTIQFENDTVFATAPAHDIYLTDTLDVNLFDLSTYRPTKITIGEKSMELTGERNFISTLDMRPEINAIAQIEGTIDDETGIVRWHISSLDPMTMEPSDDAMVGVLPVNFDGSGLGEASYEISLKKDLPHGTVIPNRSGNIFDNNETVMTPTWTNTIDRVKPVSRITKVEQVDGGPTATVSIEATDEGSGPWRYNVYVQYGSGAWFLAAENVPADTTATVKIYEGIVHRFYCVATDMAGNVEEKEARSEFTLTVSEREHGDVNGDGAVDVADIAEIIDTMAMSAYRVYADANGDGAVDVADIAEVITVMAARVRAMSSGISNP